MILEPKHKNFKYEYRIKERVKKKKLISAPHVYISGSWITLLSGTSKLVTQSL
jgi:hypothetical protein